MLKKSPLALASHLVFVLTISTVLLLCPVFGPVGISYGLEQIPPGGERCLVPEMRTALTINKAQIQILIAVNEAAILAAESRISSLRQDLTACDSRPTPSEQETCRSTVRQQIRQEQIAQSQLIREQGDLQEAERLIDELLAWPDCSD